LGEVIGSELPINAIHYMRGGRIVILSTVDSAGVPNAAPFSWVVAKDSQTIRIGVNTGITTLENIRANKNVCLTITSPDMHITIKGTARVIRDTIEEAPLPTAVVEVLVSEVKDDTVIGRTEDGKDRTRWTERRRLVSDSTIIQALLKD
jgi:nitroimidazol reductase NimA-like FMN-containing flavoprotein (pyridoxamine 5'-phosphate oxidase superfamily)